MDVQTTPYILKQRENCICPRLGDAHDRFDMSYKIKSDITTYEIQKAIDKQACSLKLRGCSLWSLPIQFSKDVTLASNIIHLDLSRNKLFNADQIF